MAYPASKRFSYLGQFGILAGFTGVGLVIGSFVALIPLLGKIDIGSMGGSSKDVMDSLFIPENAGILRIIQFITTLFVFFLPAIFYAILCHRKAFRHLGFSKSVTLQQASMVICIMFACLPLVGILGELTEMLPFSEATLAKFKKAEEEYMRQVEVIGRMNNFSDFLLSLLMLAILPAIFEETLFRGGLQNLLSRWFKVPLLAIIITSLIFSLVHFSFIGFASRAVLGFVLGWLYHRTGNLWLSIIGHVINNAVAITALYVMKLKNPDMKISDGPNFPMWSAAIGLILVFVFLYLFDRVSKHQIDRPGQEEIMDHGDPNVPDWVRTNAS